METTRKETEERNFCQISQTWMLWVGECAFNVFECCCRCGFVCLFIKYNFLYRIRIFRFALFWSKLHMCFNPKYVFLSVFFYIINIWGKNVSSIYLFHQTFSIIFCFVQIEYNMFECVSLLLGCTFLGLWFKFLYKFFFNLLRSEETGFLFRWYACSSSNGSSSWCSSRTLSWQGDLF